MNFVAQTNWKTLGALLLVSATFLFSHNSYSICFTKKCKERERMIEERDRRDKERSFVENYINPEEFIYFDSKKSIIEYLYERACKDYPRTDHQDISKPAVVSVSEECPYAKEIDDLNWFLKGLADPGEPWNASDALDARPRRKLNCAGASENFIFLDYSQGGFVVQRYLKVYRLSISDSLLTMIFPNRRGSNASLFKDTKISCPAERKLNQCIKERVKEGGILSAIPCGSEAEDNNL